jgi:hypothetical protein
LSDSNKTPPSFYYSSDVDRVLFQANNTAREDKQNTDVYPLFLNRGIFYTINPHSGSVVEDPKGQFPEGWIPGSRNSNIVQEFINSYPRHMLRNLIVVSDENGFPVPIAGSYFTKLLDHEPGSIQPLSCLITDELGRLGSLNISGNLNLGGTEDATDAINILGKINEIDCGFINNIEE